MSDSNPISETDALEWFAEMFEEPTENVTATTPREERLSTMMGRKRQTGKAKTEN